MGVKPTRTSSDPSAPNSGPTVLSATTPNETSGSHALIATQSNKACRIAQDEIEAGKIAYVKTAVDIHKPLVEGPAIPILLS